MEREKIFVVASPPIKSPGTVTKISDGESARLKSDSASTGKKIHDRELQPASPRTEPEPVSAVKQQKKTTTDQHSSSVFTKSPVKGAEIVNKTISERTKKSKDAQVKENEEKSPITATKKAKLQEEFSVPSTTKQVKGKERSEVVAVITSTTKQVKGKERSESEVVAVITHEKDKEKRKEKEKEKEISPLKSPASKIDLGKRTRGEAGKSASVSASASASASARKVASPSSKQHRGDEGTGKKGEEVEVEGRVIAAKVAKKKSETLTSSIPVSSPIASRKSTRKTSATVLTGTVTANGTKNKSNGASESSKINSREISASNKRALDSESENSTSDEGNLDQEVFKKDIQKNVRGKFVTNDHDQIAKAFKTNVNKEESDKAGIKKTRLSIKKGDDEDSLSVGYEDNGDIEGGTYATRGPPKLLFQLADVDAIFENFDDDDFLEIVSKRRS